MVTEISSAHEPATVNSCGSGNNSCYNSCWAGSYPFEAFKLAGWNQYCCHGKKYHVQVGAFTVLIMPGICVPGLWMKGMMPWLWKMTEVCWGLSLLLTIPIRKQEQRSTRSGTPIPMPGFLYNLNSEWTDLHHHSAAGSKCWQRYVERELVGVKPKMAGKTFRLFVVFGRRYPYWLSFNGIDSWIYGNIAC